MRPAEEAVQRLRECSANLQLTTGGRCFSRAENSGGSNSDRNVAGTTAQGALANLVGDADILVWSHRPQVTQRPYVGAAQYCR